MQQLTDHPFVNFEVFADDSLSFTRLNVKSYLEEVSEMTKTAVLSGQPLKQKASETEELFLNHMITAKGSFLMFNTHDKL